MGGFGYKEILNERKAILDFFEKFPGAVDAVELVNDEHVKNAKNLLFEVKVNPVIQNEIQEKGVEGKNELKELFIKEEDVKDNLVDNYLRIASDQSKDYIKRISILKAYIALGKKFVMLNESMPDKDNKILLEAKKNVILFKEKMREYGVEEWEIDAAKKGDKKLREKIVSEYKNPVDEMISEASENNPEFNIKATKVYEKLLVEQLNTKNIKGNIKSFVEEPEFNDFYVTLNKTDKIFDTQVKRYGLSYDMTIPKAPSTYEFNEEGNLIEQEPPTNFFKKIIFSIKRAWNKKEAEKIKSEFKLLNDSGLKLDMSEDRSFVTNNEERRKEFSNFMAKDLNATMDEVDKYNSKILETNRLKQKLGATFKNENDEYEFKIAKKHLVVEDNKELSNDDNEMKWDAMD